MIYRSFSPREDDVSVKARKQRRRATERWKMGYHDVIGQEAEKMLEYVESGTTHCAETTMEVSRGKKPKSS
jgi:hypothetical protein